MISLVIPVYNEELIIQKLYQRSTKALESIGQDFEIICVDDGSRDKTLEYLVQSHQQDKRFKIISLSRNFGHQAAILAGLSHAKGDFIGIMDGDLQDPPELFKDFHAKLEEGFDVVYAVRKKRKEGPLKKMAYFLFYRFMSMASKTPMPLDSGDFSMFRKEVLQEMLALKERNPFLRGIRTWVGFKQFPFEYDRDERDAGEPKYSFKKLLKLAFDGLFGFSDFPIRFMGNFGLLIMAGSFVYAIYILIERLFFENVPQGFTTLILAIIFFSGVQLFSIRILGEYIHRIFDESRKRPNFIVRKFYSE